MTEKTVMSFSSGGSSSPSQRTKSILVKQIENLASLNKWKIMKVNDEQHKDYRVHLYKQDPFRKMSLIFLIEGDKLLLRQVSYYKYLNNNIATVFIFTQDELSIYLEIDNNILERDVYIVNRKFNLVKIAKTLVQKNYPILLINKSKVLLT